MAVVNNETIQQLGLKSISGAAEKRAQDFRLVQTAAAGDERSREQLFGRLYDRVRTSVFYLAAGHTSTEDFVQLSMMEIFLSLRSFKAQSALEPWVDRITVRTTMRLLKTDRYRGGIVTLDPTPQRSVPSGVENQLYSRQVLERIAARMAKLKPHHREALTLHLVLGYSAGEAAIISNVKFETMRARVKKARRKLLRMIKNDPILVERLHLAGK